jgi:ATP-binding cassette, subfamily B, bacterial
MSTTGEHDSRDRNQLRLARALRLVVRRYADQIQQRPRVAIPALILPGIAEVLIFYVPPLIVARLLGAFARDEQLSYSELAPFIVAFAAAWACGEAIWRVAVLLMTRMEIGSMASLYIEAMDELLAKDLAFFQNNYAGSLTKRALGYARRFEDVFDVLCFLVSANVLPLVFAAAVLWSYSPLLIVTLVGLMVVTLGLVLPLIRRRQHAR